MSLFTEDAGEQAAFYGAVNAPFVGNGFTRWVDGQYVVNVASRAPRRRVFISRRARPHFECERAVVVVVVESSVRRPRGRIVHWTGAVCGDWAVLRFRVLFASPARATVASPIRRGSETARACFFAFFLGTRRVPTKGTRSSGPSSGSQTGRVAGSSAAAAC